MQPVHLTGNATLNKTKKYKWNIMFTPGKTHRLKAKLSIDKKNINFDVDINVHGNKMDVDGYKIVDGKKIPLSFKNVDIQKYKPML